MIKTEYSTYSTLAQQFNLLRDEPMKKYTSFKVGGPADLLALPKNTIELKHLLKQASGLDIPVTLFGGGTNILISDKGIRGLVVITRHLTSELSVIETGPGKKIILVSAGERLSRVCRFATEHSLSGLEWAAGIPGTVGGAIMMNAGTKKGEMSDLVLSIDVLNQKTLMDETIERKNLYFSYRQLIQPGIIVGARLKVKKGDKDKIDQTFQQILAQRKLTQPSSSASAGCFFKNPDQGITAGELIEKSGLKGVRVNDAMVSEIHANFIVNLGNARCEDILSLKQLIERTVFNKYQINLKTEVRMEGE